MKSPRELVEEKEKLSIEFGEMTDKLIDISKVKPYRWALFRADPECKSDKAADRKWESTKEGMEEYAIKLKMKAHEKRLSSISSALRLLENEARNNY